MSNGKDMILSSTQPVNADKPKIVERKPVNKIMEGLSNHVKVVIRELDKDGNALPDIVEALFIDGDKSIESQWQSPFENMSADGKFPSLMASLQSGEMSDALGAILTSVGAKTLAEGAKEKLDQVKGLTTFNKVNSEQIYLSTQSVRMSLTLGFMAYSNAKTEVEQQIMLLEKWALPKKLSDASTVENMFKEGQIFTGEIPPFVSVTLQGKTYTPMIIESVQSSLKVPTDKQGNRLNATVSLTIVSKTAWDAQDIIKLY